MTSIVRTGGGASALWAPWAHSGLNTIAAPAHLITQLCQAAAEPPCGQKMGGFTARYCMLWRDSIAADAVAIVTATRHARCGSEQRSKGSKAGECLLSLQSCCSSSARRGQRGRQPPGHRLCHHSKKRSLAPKGGQHAPLQQKLGSSSACPGKKALEGAGSRGAGCAITLRSARWRQRPESVHLCGSGCAAAALAPGRKLSRAPRSGDAGRALTLRSARWRRRGAPRCRRWRPAPAAPWL